MNARTAVTTLVDEMISKGIIGQDRKEEYVNTLSANDQMAEYFAGQMLRQSDYTKKTMELAQQRRELEAERNKEWQNIQSERQQLSQWERDTRAEVDRLRGLEGTVFAQTEKLARMEQLIKSYNLEDQLGELAYTSTPSIPSSTPTTPSISTQSEAPSMSNPDYLSRFEAQQVLQQMLQLQSAGLRIAGKHQAVFGQPLTDDLISEALQSNINPDQLESYWRTKYGVDARETTLREQKEASEREQLKAQLRSEIMGEFASDPARLMTGNPSAPRAVGSVLEQYANSRATANNPLTGDGQNPTAYVAPETKPDLRAHTQRVSDAVSYFNENFTQDGMPVKGDSRLNS